MKTILRLMLVTSLIFFLANEPPREQAKAEVQTVNNTQVEKVETPVASSPTVTPTPKPVITSEEDAKMFIYFKESGNRLDAVNSIGCTGLGQDCNGVLAKECPNWRTDRICQNLFWERYMQRRYGTWEKAKAFWIKRVPINGKDVGHWW